MIRSCGLLAALAIASAVRAQDIQLNFPVDCDLEQSCFIQNYVDRDPSTGHRDVGCGHLSYNDHKGTDIALIDIEAMADNISVHPVAAGRISATRDGMLDVSIRDLDAPDVTGRACGNAVIITHPDGWESRYCHMKRGSIAVRTGDQVDEFTRIGAIGLSGRTEFPHLHFELWHNGVLVDPFAPNSTTECGEPTSNLWSSPIKYVPAGMIAAGAAPNLPSFDAIKLGEADHSAIPADASALVFWAHFFGPQSGDVIAFEIAGPTGPFLQQSVTLDRNQARAFRAVGRKLRTQSWPVGTYTATIQMSRDGVELDRITITTRVE